MSDQLRTQVYMIMDTSQKRRLYWNGLYWVDNPCSATRSLDRDFIEVRFLRMTKANPMAALALVEYSCQNGQVTVHHITPLDKVTSI